jgi:NitT/TauT family transport system ATP-binding protein
MMSRIDLVELSVRDAVVKFGDLFALGPISFDVHKGECVVLLGPSGCGKSTLLSAIAGLQSLASGSVSLSDKTKAPGFVFQEPNLMPWATALENVILPLALGSLARGRTSHSISEAAGHQALARVGLSDFAGAKPKALSGGMAMRAALARALVDRPSGLLLDEPFGAIDELGRRTLNDLVHIVKRDEATAVIFVTHSVEEAVYMGDRILVLSPRPGTIIEDIQIPAVRRNSDFVVLPEFGELVAQVRRSLARATAQAGEVEI